MSWFNWCRNKREKAVAEAVDAATKNALWEAERKQKDIAHQKVFDEAPLYQIKSKYVLAENKDEYKLCKKYWCDGTLRRERGLNWEPLYWSWEKSECEARLIRLNDIERLKELKKNVVLT
jgi:hypothetical protein